MREQHQQHVDGAQQHAHLRVVLAREQIVVDVETESPQIEIGRDVQRGDGGPADQADDRRSAAAAPATAVSGVERRDRNRDDHRQDEQREPGHVRASG